MAALDAGHEQVRGRRDDADRRPGKGPGLRALLISLVTLGAAGTAGYQGLKNEGVDAFDPSTWSQEGSAGARARAATAAFNRGEWQQPETAETTGVIVSREGTPYQVALLQELRQNPGIVNLPENAVAARRLSRAGGYSVLLPDGSSVLVRDINVRAPMRSLEETMN